MRPSETNAAGKQAGSYAPVNGLDVYYEIHGQGAPLILLHGGVSASESFGESLAALAASRQVVAVHLQGHGHTHDIDRPLSYESMADDVAALIRHLGLEQADLMGYSMGGGVALQVAIRHPELVRKLVVVSMTMRHDGWYPEIVESLKTMASQAEQAGGSLGQSPLAQLYPEVDWVRLFTKMGEMEARPYDWSAEVEAIAAPTMLVFADADGIRPEHMVEFYKLLGGGQSDAGQDGSLRPAARLAVVPGATHYDMFATTLVAQLVTPFLDAQ